MTIANATVGGANCVQALAPIMPIPRGEPPPRAQERDEQQGCLAVGLRSTSWTRLGKGGVRRRCARRTTKRHQESRVQATD